MVPPQCIAGELHCGGNEGILEPVEGFPPTLSILKSTEDSHALAEKSSEQARKSASVTGGVTWLQVQRPEG